MTVENRTVDDRLRALTISVEYLVGELRLANLLAASRNPYLDHRARKRMAERAHEALRTEVGAHE